jgi:signal peptidase II
MPPSVFARIARYWWLLVLVGAVVAFDQVTKVACTHHLPYNPLHLHGGNTAVTVVPGFFYLIHVSNTGAAWSIFSGRSSWLAVLAAVTLAVIYLMRRQLGLHHRAVQVSFGLLCGGIIGNLIDRVARGQVIDFLDFHFGSYVYPTFNIADSAIFCGVAFYLWLNLRPPLSGR